MRSRCNTCGKHLAGSFQINRHRHGFLTWLETLGNGCISQEAGRGFESPEGQGWLHALWLPPIFQRHAFGETGKFLYLHQLQVISKLFLWHAAFEDISFTVLARFVVRGWQHRYMEGLHFK